MCNSLLDFKCVAFSLQKKVWTELNWTETHMRNWQWRDNELRETEGLNAEANDDDKRPVSTQLNFI